MSWPLSGPSQIISGDETLQVIRQGTNIPDSVIYVDGKPVKRSPEMFTIFCNVQPLNGRDLLLVPEGDRFKEQWWVFSNQEQKVLLVNDIIIRGDLGRTVKFQVQSTENWNSFTRARIMRIDVGVDS